MFQYDIKLLCNLYTSAGYIFKNLQILINNVLVSCTTAATFWMTKDGEEYMFDFYKWPISDSFLNFSSVWSSLAEALNKWSGESEISGISVS